MRRPSGWELWGWPLLFCAATVQTIRGFLEATITRNADFFAFYDSALAYRLGFDPYAFHRWSSIPNLNAPSVLLAFVPFTVLTPRLAFVIWQVCQFACLVLTSWLVARELARDRRIVIAAVLATGLAESVIYYGQIAGTLALISALAWREDRHGRSWRAGALLGPVIYAKPFLLVFVPWWAWRRDGRAAMGALIGASAAAVPGVLAFGPGIYRRWANVLADVQWIAHPANASIRGFAERCFGRASTVTMPVLESGLLAGVVAVGLTALVIVAAARALRTADIDRGWLLLVFGAVLVSPLGWGYYLLLAIGPAAAVAVRTSAYRDRLVLLAFAGLCLPWLIQTRYGPWMSATYGSAATYATVTLLALAAQRGGPSTAGWSSASVATRAEPC